MSKHVQQVSQLDGHVAPEVLSVRKAEWHADVHVSRLYLPGEINARLNSRRRPACFQIMSPAASVIHIQIS